MGAMGVGGLYQLALRITDLDASIAFYRDLIGLRLIARFDPPGIAFFEIGRTRLLLAADAPVSQFYFAVDDLAAVQAEMVERGAMFEAGPVMVHRDDAGQFGEPGTEEWMSFIRDPAGNLVGLAERRPSTPDKADADDAGGASG